MSKIDVLNKGYVRLVDVMGTDLTVRGTACRHLYRAGKVVPSRLFYVCSFLLDSFPAKRSSPHQSTD